MGIDKGHHLPACLPPCLPACSLELLKAEREREREDDD